MDNHTSNQLIAVTMAILYQDGKYLMQLRDNIAHIPYPGVWGLFGGHLDLGEEPEMALKRELKEEINYSVECLREFRSYGDSKYIRYLFSCPLTLALDKLELNEGEDLGLITPAEIERGYAFSHKRQEQKPLGDIHRQIILDFIATQAS